MLKTIIKRNGAHVPFFAEKITDAIFKASAASGSPDWKKAQELSKLVVATAEKKGKTVITVEDIQDLVEQVLIENGLAKIAKAYILYRQHRAEVREEKAQILGKNEIDDVDKKFDTNALRVLVARYLRKNSEGKLTESPRELFTRVCVHTTIPSIFYDKKVFNPKSSKNVNYKPSTISIKKYLGKAHIGEYELNEFHLEAVERLFDRYASRGQMKVTLEKFLGMLAKGEFDGYAKEIKEYFDLIVARKFVPNTPALANFGNTLGMGSACFVLGVEDSIDDIMDKLKAAAIIFKAGGGVGYNFSKLRFEGDFVKSTGGVASGPISFMSMFDNMTDVIKQGGIRRGANMGILNSNHPDILKFIKAKEGNKALRNFNISVLLTGDFWKYYQKKEPYPLINPRGGEVVGYVDARQLFELLAYQAWESAEPGVIFADHANEFNPFLKHLGPIVTTNPCGEVLLYPYESCNLGSLNIWAFIDGKSGKKPEVMWDDFSRAITVATRFLDNVTDVNKYPLKEIEEMTLSTRKLGLGIMGMGDALYELDLAYNSKAGLDFMERTMEFVNYYSKVASIDLARTRGSLPLYKKSFYQEGRLPFAGFADKKSWHFDWKKISQDIKKYGIRNGYTTVIAPTGSISMIAGCSSGIEPVYSLVFEKHVTVGSFYYVDPVFEDHMRKEGLMDDDLIKDVAAHHGSLGRLSYIPEKIKKTFVTAHDIVPADHIRALAVIQKWVDSSISKTNNLPADATVEDVKEVYRLAYELGCKDVTVFRDGSLTTQVLVSSSKSDKNKKVRDEKKEEKTLVHLKDEKAKGMEVYKEASVRESVHSLGISPAVEVKNGDDGADFNGAVKCKLCNL